MLCQLQSRLPLFLVENRALYSILSKGVHELSEDVCMKYFEVVRTAIELILDERLAQREKQAKLDAVSTQVNELHSRLGKQDNDTQLSTVEEQENEQ